MPHRQNWKGHIDMNKLHMIAKGVAPILAALLMTACAAPEFKQPAMEVPTAFKESQTPEASVKVAADGSTWKQAQAAEAQPRGEWWLAFNDPALNELVNEATRANANLAVAAARVKQARAIAGIAEADRIPQVGVGVGAQRVRQSATELGLPAGTPVAPAKVFNANLTASYEVDLFGRVSSNVAAARGDAASVEANYRSVLLAVQADVAQTYFRLRATAGRKRQGQPASFRPGRHRRIRSVARQDRAGDRESGSHRPAASARDDRTCAGGLAGQAGGQLHGGRQPVAGYLAAAGDSGRLAVVAAGTSSGYLGGAAFDGSGQCPHRRGAFGHVPIADAECECGWRVG
jgi:hypothetical protein